MSKKRKAILKFWSQVDEHQSNPFNFSSTTHAILTGTRHAGHDRRQTSAALGGMVVSSHQTTWGRWSPRSILGMLICTQSNTCIAITDQFWFQMQEEQSQQDRYTFTGVLCAHQKLLFKVWYLQFFLCRKSKESFLKLFQSTLMLVFLVFFLVSVND